MHNSDSHENQYAPHDHAESGSRKSSVTTQLTSQTRASTAETYVNAASIQTEDSSQPLKEFEPSEYDEIVHLGTKLAGDPVNAQQWLIDYGHYKDGTNVSLRFRNTAAYPRQSDSHSLIPIFLVWIPVWYKAAVQRRKVDKLSRDASYKEQDDFDWLLKFIADYIRLGHENFDEQELTQLCTSITQVCQETGRQSVINDSIVILHNILLETIFPKDALPLALEVFCAGTVTLPDLPAELFDSVRLLLIGPLQKQAIEWLLNCITTPTVQNNSDRLIEARGAIRQMRHHLDLVDADGALAIELQLFLDCIHQASKCCIFRFCTEVLLACRSVLESDQRQKLLALDMRTFVDTIENCTRTVLLRNSNQRSMEALRSPDRAQIMESQRQNDKHLAERRAAMQHLLEALETTWDNFSDSQARIVGELFMDHAKDLTDSQAAAVITHLSKRGLLLPGTDDWSQRGIKAFDSFVRNPRIAGRERVAAAELCVDAAASAVAHAATDSSTSRESTLAAGKNIVDRLLNMIGKEYNTSFIKAILVPLRHLTDVVDENDKPQYASLIISKLLYLVRTEREGDDEISDEHVLLFTQAIRDIFLRGLQGNASVISEAYDALLEIASARCKSRRCRLAALRLLLRIRCDSEGMIFVQTALDSEYIAAALCRTEDTREQYAKELSTQQRGSGTHVASSPHSISARQLWLYPKEAFCMTDWETQSSKTVSIPAQGTSIDGQVELDMMSWLVTIIESLQSDNDWETYSYILVHLGAQLFNIKLFSMSLHAIVMLRQVLCDQIHNNSFKDPPASTGLKKSDAALCMFNMLTALIPYASMRSEKIQKGFGDDLVRAFVTGIGNTWDGTHRGCIHALSVCTFEIPASVASSYPSIVQTMGKNMSQAHLTIHILEFLAQVARLPEVHSSFNQNEITQIFGICLQFLEKARDNHLNSLTSPASRSGTPARHSGLSLRRPPYRAAIHSDTALPQYASSLAYHTMIFWFLSLRLEVRARYVSWIVPRLVWKNARGEEVIEEQSQVFIDMMQRTAFSDLGETAPNPSFAADRDGTISSASWIVGLSIVTAETAGHTGLTQITKRQAAGTTYTLYQQLTTSTPSHHAPLHTQLRPDEVGRFGTTDMLPAHIILQMVSTAAPTNADDHPIYLPKEDYVTRALNVFDRIPTVDSHKIGVLYIGPGQHKEVDYLANTEPSASFERFVHGLGYLVSLEPPLRYNPQGLQHPRDGDATIAWRDRTLEVVYHVPTMMPNNLEDDPSYNIKKSHVGNCHVVIVFNESGLPWQIDNFSSAVTFVQVVVTPVNRAGTQQGKEMSTEVQETVSAETSSITTTETRPTDFYQVHVVTKADYPNVSPAADPKVVSGDTLPAFVRMFSINANLFSHAKVAADGDDDEHPSSWRARLQAIKRLKDRVIEKSNGPLRNHSVTGGGPERSMAASGRKTPIFREEGQGPSTDGALALQLDFGNWTSPPEKDQG